MGPYKPSFYNMFFDSGLGGSVLGYNSMANTLLNFSGDDFQVVRRILSCSFDEEEQEHDVFRMLRDNGFLVPTERDELQEIRKTNLEARRDAKTLSLTIAPTLSCNFRCTYCFEEHPADAMSPKVMRALEEFTRHRLADQGTLYVTWFGGEPLLRLDVIEHLTAAFKTICGEKKAGFSAEIITNGLLLDEPVAKTLRECGVSHAQVTLDGPQPVHDARRPDAGGRGTFERIVRNIRKAKDHLPINLRVNLDKSNREQMGSLLAYLEKEALKDNISVYPGQVKAYSDVCRDIAAQCLCDKEFADCHLQFEMLRYRHDLGKPGYPSRRRNVCAADRENSFVIAPSGHMFKCWNEIAADAEQAIGSLLEQDPEISPANPYRWEAWNVFQYPACRECRLLPVCMGGCPYLSRMQKQERGFCTRFKYSLADSMRLYHGIKQISEQEGGENPA